jgi:hypothetical protein
MRFFSLHRENTVPREDRELFVPSIFHELGRDCVNVPEAVDVGYGDFIWGNADNIAVLLMQLINEEDTTAADNSFLEW